MDLPWYSLLIPLFVFLFFLHQWFFTSSSNQKRLPPSPRKLPIIGNLHQLGPHPYRTLHKLSEKHGPVVLLHFGSKPELVASSVDAARAIMKTHDLVCSSRPKSSIVHILFYGSKDIGFSPYVVDLRDHFCSLTGDIVSRVALGRKYNKGESGMNAKLDTKVEKVAKDLDTFLESVIEEHIIRSKKGEYSTGEAKDFVNVLLDIQNGKETGFSLEMDSLKAVILDIFAAGIDTTHTTLEWIMTELLRHPKAMEKLQNEVRGLAQGKSKVTEDDLENMQFLKAVIKETLRLHPPVPLLIPRQSTEDIELLGYLIPAKTQILINAWTIGRDPLSWENPEEYRPERFLNSKIDVKGLNFELIPFGAGRRGYPGIAFAVVINGLALARLVHEFNFALPEGLTTENLEMTEGSGVTIRRKSPLLAVATPYML
ncbi:Cytochrome 71A4 [Capsicum baccatum]|uniref:Cytochrome 71A4 n=1 Tax=Capsicum baccatum TaxID=33114 RepID=A0A2G2XE89_CAPBA|nr:Cytochrome 71A4 [Capsicum baccatum]